MSKMPKKIYKTTRKNAKVQQNPPVRNNIIRNTRGDLEVVGGDG